MAIFPPIQYKTFYLCCIIQRICHSVNGISSLFYILYSISAYIPYLFYLYFTQAVKKQIKSILRRLPKPDSHTSVYSATAVTNPPPRVCRGALLFFVSFPGFSCYNRRQINVPFMIPSRDTPGFCRLPAECHACRQQKNRRRRCHTTRDIS